MLDLRKTPVVAIMSEDVLTLQGDASLAEAVATLRDYRVSGAPVVDPAGFCVGVFSLSDLARREEEAEDGETPRAGSYFNFGLGEKLSLPEEDYDPEVFDRETVGDWMSPDVKAIPFDATAADAAKAMVENGIHRLLVTEGAEIKGIVTSFDLARLVAGLPAREPATNGEKPPKKARRRTAAKAKAKRARA